VTRDHELPIDGRASRNRLQLAYGGDEPVVVQSPQPRRLRGMRHARKATGYSSRSTAPSRAMTPCLGCNRGKDPGHRLDRRVRVRRGRLRPVDHDSNHPRWPTKAQPADHRRSALCSRDRQCCRFKLAGWTRTSRSEVARARFPLEKLVSMSARTQLIVVGRQGKGAFAAHLLGSVSQRLMTHAHCRW
jgi:hypothetical protein